MEEQSSIIFNKSLANDAVSLYDRLQIMKVMFKFLISTEEGIKKLLDGI